MANLETRPAGPASDKAAIRVRFVPRTAAHRRWRTRTYTIAVGMDHDLQEVAGAARDQQPRIEPRQRRAHVLHGPAGRSLPHRPAARAPSRRAQQERARLRRRPHTPAAERLASLFGPLCRRLPMHAVCGLTGQGSARAQLYQCWLAGPCGPGRTASSWALAASTSLVDMQRFSRRQVASHALVFVRSGGSSSLQVRR